MKYLKRTEPWVPPKKITIEVPKEIHAILVDKVSKEQKTVRKKLVELVEEYLNETNLR